MRKTYILCTCCATKLANDDESGCRDYLDHTHPVLSVPADVVITQDGQVWDGIFDLTCHGHEGGIVAAGEQFWVAEIVDTPAADVEAKDRAAG